MREDLTHRPTHERKDNWKLGHNANNPKNNSNSNYTNKVAAVALNHVALPVAALNPTLGGETFNPGPVLMAQNLEADFFYSSPNLENNNDIEKEREGTWLGYTLIKEEFDSSIQRACNYLIKK